jgi:hypothetical protein
MQPGKISHFPAHIREELNQRLDNGKKATPILTWLNSLPEVKAVLDQHFQGEPVKRQNLDAWKNSGFHNWQLLRSALSFSQETLPDDLDQSMLEKMSAKLIRYLQLRYAAVAGSLPPPHSDPEAELRRLALLCGNLSTLRRGDLSATRLQIEQQRLAMEQAEANEQKEAEFWKWTHRPDVQAKLYPHRDPEKERRDVDRLISERMLGIRVPSQDDSTPDPACLI